MIVWKRNVILFTIEGTQSAPYRVGVTALLLKCPLAPIKQKKIVVAVQVIVFGIILTNGVK